MLDISHKVISTRFSYRVFKAIEVRPVSWERVVLRVRPAGIGKRRDEDRLQRDQDLAEGRLLHQSLQLLEVNAHAEGGAVTVHLSDTHSSICVHPFSCNGSYNTTEPVLSAYWLVAELQQFVRQPSGVSDEFLQRLFETDGFLENLITAIHPHWIRRLRK